MRHGEDFEACSVEWKEKKSTRPSYDTPLTERGTTECFEVAMERLKCKVAAGNIDHNFYALLHILVFPTVHPSRVSPR